MNPEKSKWPSGWFPVWSDDLKAIGDHYGRSPGREKAPAIKAVHLACCQLAKERGFQPFVVNIALIANIAATGYKTTAKALKELEQIGLLKIENITPGGLDAPRRYTVLRTVGITERYPIGLTDQLPTSSYSLTGDTLPPPPQAGAFESFILRFRSIEHPNFRAIPEQAVLRVLQPYDVAVIESALADLGRDGPGEPAGVNPLKMLSAYLREAKRQSDNPAPPTPTRKGKGKRKQPRLEEHIEPREAIL
jgi:hypothetical protein